jgi:hypothetical protein
MNDRCAKTGSGPTNTYTIQLIQYVMPVQEDIAALMDGVSAVRNNASTANCTIIDHFSGFESGLVAPFLALRDKTAGCEPNRPEM